MVQVWDESLFAITADEMADSGDWIGTTFLGALDYYNSKPPLQVWLVAAAFKAFGPGLVTLRLPAMIAAWLTVAVLLWWATRAFGKAIGVVAGVVLATCYGFLYVHAGRSGNSDSLFTLLILLTVVTLWASRDHPWRRVWLGVVVGLVFLVKGMGILMPSLIIGLTELGGGRWRGRTRWLPLLSAAGAFALIVTPWIVARWRVDGWLFFDAMFFHDFADRVSVVLEGHEGGPFYYVYFLQRNQYDWLLAAAVALLCLPDRWARFRTLVTGADRFTTVLLAAWFAGAFLMPTSVATKLGWYLNPFYPLFALGIAWLIVEAWQATVALPRGTALVAASFVVAFGVAEGKLAWHSYRLLDLGRSAQSLILAHRADIDSRNVYATQWPHSDRFVVRSVGGRCITVPGVDEFLGQAHADDLWLGAPGLDARLVPLASTGRQTLYRKAN